MSHKIRVQGYDGHFRYGLPFFIETPDAFHQSSIAAKAFEPRRGLSLSRYDVVDEGEKGIIVYAIYDNLKEPSQSLRLPMAILDEVVQLTLPEFQTS